jgi:hypothetical protein
VNGQERFFTAARRYFAKPTPPEMPKPPDQWGAWVNYRLDRLESQQTWLLRLLVGAMATQVGLQVLNLLK